jgi:acyl-CoA thioesterase YciA
MKTFLIIIALINIDSNQNIYSYKAVRVRTEEEVKSMKKIDRVCDTFTVFTTIQGRSKIRSKSIMDLLSTHPVKKSDLGFHGNLFGGKLLSWVDAALAAYAMEKCRSQNMITIALNQCVFRKPAKEKQLVKIYAEMTKIGNTSATFAVEARGYNVFRGDEVVLLATTMTFVRVDEEGIPIPISEQVKRVFNTPPSKL